MIIMLVQCETCTNSFRLPPHARPYERDAPTDWLTVFEGNPQGSEGLHFCSLKCLRAWAGTKDTTCQHEEEAP